MKKVFSIIFLISLINSISAYSEFSNFLDQIEITTLFLIAIFIISFAIIYFTLSRIFKDNKAIPAIVSLLIALLITKGFNDSTILYELDSFKYWIQNLSWGGVIFTLLILGIFIWIVYEEIKKKKK
ncbi:hypothetical protein K9M16_05010 [Candidatus Babeliales bacterium]|nr:hypothetical protein [Candidatus Babeliales bacterium]MCF7910139.1 hypothetical protein [Candidatus Pacearchaeota archaeon]